MENAESLKTQGITQFNRGNFAGALEAFKIAYDLFLTEGKETEAGEMLNNIGMVHRSLEQTEPALEAMKQAREIFIKLGDKDREGQTAANMAPLHIMRKEFAHASMLYSESEDLLKAAGDSEKLGDVLMSHGLHEFEHGNKRASLDLYERGLLMIKKPTAKQKSLQTLLKVKTAFLK